MKNISKTNKMKNLLIISFLLLFGGYAFGQEDSEYFTKGKQKYKESKFKSAIKYINKAIEQDSLVYDYLLYRGLAKQAIALNHYKHEEEFYDAIKDYSKLIALNSSNYRGYFYRGMTRFEMVHIDHVIDSIDNPIILLSLKDFETTLSLDSTILEAYNKIAMIHENFLSNPELALKYYDMGLVIEPNNRALLSNRAYLKKAWLNENTQK